MANTAAEASAYKSLSRIARKIPSSRGDKPVHTATLTRWILRGVEASDGTVVKLEAKKTPGGWVTTEEAVERFFARLTSAALGGGAEIESMQGSKARRRELSRVENELVAAGF